jgi:hypothetical protein
VKLVVLRTERDAQGRPLVGADGKQVERRLEFTVALGDASNLDRFDAMEARAMGVPNNVAMNRANLPLQQRAWQAASILYLRFLRSRSARSVPHWRSPPQGASARSVLAALSNSQLPCAPSPACTDDTIIAPAASPCTFPSASFATQMVKAS